MKSINCLALDLGASNGRVILGKFDGNKLSLTELHRFANEPVRIMNNLQWDILRLYHEFYKALAVFTTKNTDPLLSIGIDSWGSDFGLLDRKGLLIGNPYHYRDRRIEGIIERVSDILNEKELFYLTGNASIKYNTVYQLLSMYPSQSTLLDNARTMLLIPDLIAYFLTGEKAIEYTNATTTQLMGNERKTWSNQVLNAFDIPSGILPSIQQPSSPRGKVIDEWQCGLQLKNITVVATATHDTASAIAATPDLNEQVVFLSSGTWSLIGVETDKIFINEDVYRTGFSNEGGVDGKNLLLRNTVGMWIIQECAREWQESGDFSDYDTLMNLAGKSGPSEAWIDPDCNDFALPGDMPEKIRHYCRKTIQKVPETKGQLFRCIYESMALKYRWCLENLELILGHSLNALYIVGGGSKHKLLNQFTANAIKKSVICGPIEATAAGNIMVQLKSFGEIGSLKDIRKVISDSFKREIYEPKDISQWDDAYDRYLKIQTENNKKYI